MRPSGTPKGTVCQSRLVATNKALKENRYRVIVLISATSGVCLDQGHVKLSCRAWRHLYTPILWFTLTHAHAHAIFISTTAKPLPW